MKRTRTLIEQKLQQDGWYLTGKTYIGKHSDKTQHYTYEKFIKEHLHIILLNNKRDKVVNCGIVSQEDIVNEQTLELHKSLYIDLETYCKGLEEITKPIPKELLESVE